MTVTYINQPTSSYICTGNQGLLDIQGKPRTQSRYIKRTIRMGNKRENTGQKMT